jgi:hypothetical protein
LIRKTATLHLSAASRQFGPLCFCKSKRPITIQPTRLRLYDRCAPLKTTFSDPRRRDCSSGCRSQNGERCELAQVSSIPLSERHGRLHDVQRHAHALPPRGCPFQRPLIEFRLHRASIAGGPRCAIQDPRRSRSLRSHFPRWAELGEPPLAMSGQPARIRPEPLFASRGGATSLVIATPSTPPSNPTLASAH